MFQSQSLTCRHCGKHHYQSGNTVCVTCCGQVLVFHRLDHRTGRTEHSTLADAIRRKAGK